MGPGEQRTAASRTQRVLVLSRAPNMQHEERDKLERDDYAHQAAAEQCATGPNHQGGCCDNCCNHEKRDEEAGMFTRYPSGKVKHLRTERDSGPVCRFHGFDVVSLSSERSVHDETLLVLAVHGAPVATAVPPPAPSPENS